VLFIGQLYVLRKIGFHVFIILVSTLFLSTDSENPQCIQGLTHKAIRHASPRHARTAPANVELDLTY
jgi:hypothetical protein